MMDGKICLVTGATSGIGSAAAVELARMGATVIIGARNEAKAEKARRRIGELSESDDLHTAIADLSLQSEVRRLGGELEMRFPRIDVLINNAAGVFFRRQTTSEGIEKTWATNHLSYFLLTSLLMPALERSEAGRIVNVSSSAHKRGEIYFDDVELKEGYSWRKAYGQSKLANLLFSYELSRNLKGKNITVNALHPGWVATEIGQNFWLARITAPLIFRSAKTPEQGAETVVHLASAKEIEGVTGKFFIDKVETESAAHSHDRESAKRLWAISETMTRER
ncbi:MAG: SDR family oxidoreductase [Anaerolineae bacterium]|nr:SDR family oxidoreductase [Anaerolineae bacterium]